MGKCPNCGCCNYLREFGANQCLNCGYVPVHHEDVSQLFGVPSANPHRAPQCKLPGCLHTAYYENGKYYDFCRRSHKAEYDHLQLQTIGQITAPKCKIPNCPNPAYYHNGQYYDCCSKRHADLLKQLQQCSLSPCSSSTSASISSLPKESSDYRKIAKLFINSWEKGTNAHIRFM